MNNERAAFWNSLLTEKSWQMLQELRRKYTFVLIGGWAVYLHTRQQKSKDIDIAVSLQELEKLKGERLGKNDRLKKYEIKKDEIDIDIYVEHYSEIGIPVEDLQKNAVDIEGFSVVRAELLLVLKQAAYESRAFSAKGEKDALDILSLLLFGAVHLPRYTKVLKAYGFEHYRADLKKLVRTFKHPEMLGLDVRDFNRRREEIVRRL